MDSILIKNGRILDPASGRDEVGDLLIKEGIIARVGGCIEEKADQVLEAEGCFVMPGFIDLHVHFRDPGQTHKEDVESGGKAAARGGFTSVVTMPNTSPAIDRPDKVAYVKHKAAQLSPIHVLQAGTVTMGQKGLALSDLEGMIKEGIPAVTEDGKSVMDTKLYREAMRICAKYDIPVFAHCEDKWLVDGGCVNDDEITREMGYRGISNSVEDVIVARDILLAKETGCQLHLCHCSTEGSAELLKAAKERGLRVSGEVCPHHFTLSTEDLVEGDTSFKMNPPLRTKKDVDALKKALQEDVFEVISTDHAPHTMEEKAGSMQAAPFGIVGLETCLPLVMTELVEPGFLSPMQMAAKMSYNPARIIHSDRGSLEEGRPADVTLVDPDRTYLINPKAFLSKGQNTPFGGREVRGAVITTICDGKIVYKEGMV